MSAPDSVPTHRSGLLLLAILSATALVVFAVRAVQTVEIMASVGAPLSRVTIVATQGAFWLAWSFWAAALIPLARRLVERRPAALWSAAQLLAAAVVPVLVVPALALPVHKLLVPSGQGWPATFSHLLGHNAITNLLLGAAIAALAWGYLTVQRARRLELTAARLHGELAEAQLQALRAQLDPHFLFNALNSIAVLARRGQTDAVEQMVTGLAALLRHSLESSREQLVTLGVELAALRQYLAIEQVRHGARLVVVVDVPDALHHRMVPSFLLQPLVENAVQHGFTSADQVLRLTVRAEETPGHLTLSVNDDGPGLERPGGAPDGVGLRNTRARLTGLYGGAAALTLTAGDGGRGVRATVTLPSAPGAAP